MDVAALSPTSRPLPLLSTAPTHRLRPLPPRSVSGRRLRPSPRPRGFGCVGDGVARRGSAHKNGVLRRSSSSASVEPATQEVGTESSGEWSGDAIRRRFLDFYAAHGHKILPSSSLVPDDPTVFLTIAGMLQFKPIFLGKEPRRVPCATTSQKCIRTNDIENVGRTSRHQTFFEMLGNFSFGGYFKKEAIKWAWDLTTKEYGLPPGRLWVSVFEDDDEAFTIWHNEVGVPEERIKRMGKDDNFWTSGATGPCGPCSEIYYDFHPEGGSSNADLGDDSRFIEFYNLVFMQYNKKDDGSLEPLKQKNIDTGMGLERMARILQKVPNNYETDLIFPIIEKAASMALVSYTTADDATKTKLKIIGDHMRAVVYLISDGVVPSNIGRGYVVRRLIRRVIRTGRLIGIRGDVHGNSEGAFLPSLAEVVISLSSEIDPYVESRRKTIIGELQREELRFVQTLERGEKLLDELLDEALLSAGDNGDKPCLSGKDVFLLYDTYGFPVEITAEVAVERGVTVDMKGFDFEMENQRKQSQAAHNVIKLSVGNETEIVKSIPDTEFLGYDSLSATAVVKGLLVNGSPVENVSEGSDVEILLDRTPFYAESGGQVGDNGFLYAYEEEGGKQNAVIEIKDVQKSLGNIFAPLFPRIRSVVFFQESGGESGGWCDSCMDAERRGLRRPFLSDDEASGSNRSSVPLEAREQEVHKASHCSNKAPKIVLSLQFLEVTAFYGVYLNLIVYLQDVLHGESASNVATVSSWAGASYLMPVLGAAVADSYWGKYKTVLVSLSISLVGMAIITTSATLPSLRPPPCGQSSYCTPATLSQELVFFSGIYLCAIGIGAAKAVFLSFGAEQFDDDNGKNALERERKASYFSSFYAVANLGILTAGTLLVWVEDKVSWGLGYGICASFVAVAVVGLAATAPMYRILPPVGSPLKGACQVLVAFSRKVKLTVPEDTTELYEEDVKNSLLHPVHERLEHSDQFRCLDKAAIITDEDLGDVNPWRLSTVTQVEELKILLRLIPIWLTSVVYFVANTQAQTTFVQQGTKTDSKIARGVVSVPAASLTSIETVFAGACITLYNRAIAPAAGHWLGRAQAFTPLQLMGFGHATAAVAVGVAACTEARRLQMAREGAPPMGIAWLLPQYVVMAMSDASLTVGQLEFFYDQSPKTMRGASTAFYFLSNSFGNLLNSQLVTLVASVTAAGGRTGWFPPDMDDGHLDYYFLLVVAITAANFAVFVALAKNYTPKRVR